MNLLCVAHDCEPYGHLVDAGGKPMSVSRMAKLVRITPAACAKLLEELLAEGVVRRSDAGVYYSKRMVLDEELRNRRAEGGSAGAEHGIKGGSHGRKGGRPRGGQGGAQEPPSSGQQGGFGNPPSGSVEGGAQNPPSTAANGGIGKPPPSSSSSSPSSPSEEEGGGTASAFPAPPREEGGQRTPAEEVCERLRCEGIEGAYPAHPTLQRLLAEGASVSEFLGPVEKAKHKGDPFTYLLSTVLGMRSDAAKVQVPQVKLATQAWDRSEASIAEAGKAVGLVWSADGWVQDLATKDRRPMTLPAYRLEVAARRAAGKGGEA